MGEEREREMREEGNEGGGRMREEGERGMR